MSAMEFFLIWLSFTVLVLIAAAAAVTWAFRNGHFKDQDRARYLALWAEVPGEETESTKFQAPPCTRDKRSLPPGASKLQ